MGDADESLGKSKEADPLAANPPNKEVAQAVSIPIQTELPLAGAPPTSGYRRIYNLAVKVLRTSFDWAFVIRDWLWSEGKGLKKGWHLFLVVQGIILAVLGWIGFKYYNTVKSENEVKIRQMTHAFSDALISATNQIRSLQSQGMAMNG
jgi:hypothetical protein